MLNIIITHSFSHIYSALNEKPYISTYLIWPYAWSHLIGSTPAGVGSTLPVICRRLIRANLSSGECLLYQSCWSTHYRWAYHLISLIYKFNLSQYSCCFVLKALDWLFYNTCNMFLQFHGTICVNVLVWWNCNNLTIMDIAIILRTTHLMYVHPHTLTFWHLTLKG